MQHFEKYCSNDKYTNNFKTYISSMQGGVVTSWFPDLTAEDASKGYYPGARLLNFLSPNSNQKTIEVPVSLKYNDEISKDGISRKSAILQQTQSALEILI